MERAEADAELTRLKRTERAIATRTRCGTWWPKGGQRIAVLTALIEDIGIAIGSRADTRGDAFTMTIDGTGYTKRTDAGRHLQLP
jgi:hypothetical protein